ncbi:hypothetical protein TVAG_292750 [Trichomonas vaginalis G3]|uniref:DSC E3 ubiquitin ligase complex subunit 3 C-terminal domain-containing protein n=1 Tax=Trichomonas vaginalis (strain ATCC PRA-98 / G3) TaxID=412133 RepID=A2F0E7_TRIV3|nr:hypothetical protein TVAGG3_0216620 [Trichomonas vaginalis G3]EAY01642.1 hypothetical protein TVAG_292750 [Trichomonas vaginalis G3]KAI5551607.1 hypothetical protein TVAGG3_0216620 [Trichomonas vaginalis G3]|eukprot:XP_001330374.1 hypothetical protein [Trichomonas vaginalis G3]
MIEPESDPSKIVITAAFEDRSRKRYTLSKDATAESFLKTILSDPTITKPQKANACLVKDGYVYERDDLLTLDSGEKEFLVNVVWDPYIQSNSPNSLHGLLGMYTTNLDDDNTIILDEGAVDDLADIFPNLFFRRRDTNEYRVCGFIGVRRFIIGFLLGLISGPLSLVILPCYDFDISNILGICLGVIVWILGFLLVTIKF